MKKILYPLLFLAYVGCCVLALKSENTLGDAITLGLIKMQKSNTAFASSKNEDSISSILSERDVFSALSGVEVTRDENVTMKRVVDDPLKHRDEITAEQMKPIWQALDKAYFNIPDECSGAKETLLLVINNAKKRAYVTEKLAMQWVRHVRLTQCFDMELARTMFPTNKTGD